MKPLKESTRQKHLRAAGRLYDAAQRIHCDVDCLDRFLAELNCEVLENILVGFLAQLRNQSAINGNDYSGTWAMALRFVTDILRYGGSAAGSRAGEIQLQLLRLEKLYCQLSPAPVRPPPPIRALPSVVVEELYSIFDPNSERNPFNTEASRWRNFLIFTLLLRLGLRRGEACILPENALKDDLDLTTGNPVYWLNVEGVADIDPRYPEPGLKTVLAERQLPMPKELVAVYERYVQNYRGKSRYGSLLMSQKRRPLSLRACNEIFETATSVLSSQGRSSLDKQSLHSVTCHELRHTCAVVRMRLYQDSGVELDRAMEKLRLFFGWTPESDMPRLYARAYFETALSEVWNEKFEHFVDALRRSSHRDNA